MIPDSFDDSAISDNGNNTDPNEIELAPDIKNIVLEVYSPVNDTFTGVAMDLFVFCLGKDGKLTNDDFIAFYNNPVLFESNDHDKEYFIYRGEELEFPLYYDAYHLCLNSVPLEISQIVFIWILYDARTRRQDLGQCKYVRIRLGNDDCFEVAGLRQTEQEKKTTLFQKDISKPLTNATAINLAQLERTNIGWRFCFNDTPMSMGIADICETYGMIL